MSKGPGKRTHTEDSYLFYSSLSMITGKRTRPPLTSGLDAKSNLLDLVPWLKTERGVNYSPGQPPSALEICGVKKKLKPCNVTTRPTAVWPGVNVILGKNALT